MDLNLFQARGIADTFEEERAHRKYLQANRTSFGIQFLDDATGGMYPNDLIVIGSKPGVGKTELVTNIAYQNISRGKRVYLFALEASHLEITSRIKFKLTAQKFYAQPNLVLYGPHFNFRNWFEGKLEDRAAPLESEVELEWKQLFSQFFVQYKSGDFGAEQLKASILSIKDQADVIIIDHLHYIDQDDVNENRGMESIMKILRDLSLMSNKPIILVAHVRKSDSRFKTLMPDLEDFHGSSNISKICTKAIFLAPVLSPIEGLKWNQYPTYMRIGKNRMDGSVTRFTSIMIFDVTKNEYEKKYKLGRLSLDGKEFAALEAKEEPEWHSNPIL